MSGTTPLCSNAKSVPVRPRPHWISSYTSMAPVWSARRRAAMRNSSLSGMIPPSPMTGSRKIAEVFSDTAASSAATLFGSTNVTSGMSGAKGAR